MLMNVGNSPLATSAIPIDVALAGSSDVGAVGATEPVAPRAFIAQGALGSANGFAQLSGAGAPGNALNLSLKELVNEALLL
jgi:hypothetical protein